MAKHEEIVLVNKTILAKGLIARFKGFKFCWIIHIAAINAGNAVTNAGAFHAIGDKACLNKCL